MKTTEIFVEQVIIGFLLLLILMLPFAGTLFEQLKSGSPTVPTKYETTAAFVLISMLVGAAYLLGLVCDRCTDTLLKDLDQHNRLGLAREAFKALSDKVPEKPEDPYPEHLYRIAVLSGSEATAYAEYLRARIRLTRSLATLAPALGVSALVFDIRRVTGQDWSRLGLMFIGIGYGLTLFAKIASIGYGPPKTFGERESLVKYFELRKTAGGSLRLAAREWMFWLLLSLTAFGMWLAQRPDYGRLWIPWTAFGLSLIAGWCWWRITETYTKFLRDFFTSKKNTGIDPLPVGGRPTA